MRTEFFFLVFALVARNIVKKTLDALRAYAAFGNLMNATFLCSWHLHSWTNDQGPLHVVSVFPNISRFSGNYSVRKILHESMIMTSGPARGKIYFIIYFQNNNFHFDDFTFQTPATNHVKKYKTRPDQERSFRGWGFSISSEEIDYRIKHGNRAAKDRKQWFPLKKLKYHFDGNDSNYSVDGTTAQYLYGAQFIRWTFNLKSEYSIRTVNQPEFIKIFQSIVRLRVLSAFVWEWN